MTGVSAADSRVRIGPVRPLSDRASTYQFGVSIGPDLPVGVLNTTITVSTDLGEQPTVVFRVFANVRESTPAPK